jgi:hypothetical protein
MNMRRLYAIASRTRTTLHLSGRSLSKNASASGWPVECIPLGLLYMINADEIE